MYNFFVEKDKSPDGLYVIEGADYNHIKNVLRMKVGERIIISYNGKSDLCEIFDILPEYVQAKVLEENYNDTSLPIKIVLMQGLPKGDKIELIIQKAVELGVDEIIPVETERSVVKIDGKKRDGKIARWQAISESASKQSKRNFIPEISTILTFNEAIEKAKDFDLFIVPYECKDGMKATTEALSLIKKGMTVGVFIGPEGGISDGEIKKAEAIGAKIISLGKRVLRSETAAVITVGTVALYAEIKL